MDFLPHSRDFGVSHGRSARAIGQRREWNEAGAQFDEYELSQLLFAITAINSWNRLMIATRTEAGHYQPAAGVPEPAR